MNTFFWTSFFLLFAIWIVYPIILLTFTKVFPVKDLAIKYIQKRHLLSVIIAAHNEEDVIEQRIKNILATAPTDFDYEVIVISDHSTDNTVSIMQALAAQDKRVKVYEVKNGRGRAAAHNEAVTYAKGEILIFTDAETEFAPGFLDAIGHAYDYPRVGFASGQLYWKENANKETGDNVSFYWRFEIWLRKMESRLGILATGTGACCSVRKELYRTIPLTSDIDCVTPIDVVMQGYRVVIIPSAKATDFVAATVKGEFLARSRMTAKNFYGTLVHLGWKGLIRKPLVSAGLFFHKIGRWLTPFFVIFMMASGSALVTFTDASLLVTGPVLLGWLVIFTALVGSLNSRLPVAGPLWMFMVANAAFATGVLQVIFNRIPVQYNKT